MAQRFLFHRNDQPKLVPKSLCGSMHALQIACLHTWPSKLGKQAILYSVCFNELQLKNIVFFRERSFGHMQAVLDHSSTLSHRKTKQNKMLVLNGLHTVKLHLYIDSNRYLIKTTHKNMKKSTAPGIPRRSPIQVLTGLAVA